MTRAREYSVGYDVLTMFLHRSGAEDCGAVGNQAAPTEAVHTGEDDRVVQHAETDWALVGFQDLCSLLAFTILPLHPPGVVFVLVFFLNVFLGCTICHHPTPATTRRSGFCFSFVVNLPSFTVQPLLIPCWFIKVVAVHAHCLHCSSDFLFLSFLLLLGGLGGWVGPARQILKNI